MPNQRLQELYAEARKRGMLKENPRLAELIAESVKRGDLQDLSGGTNYAKPAPQSIKPAPQASAPSVSQYSLPAAGTPPPPPTPQVRRPGVTFRQPELRSSPQPSPKAASLYQGIKSKGARQGDVREADRKDEAFVKSLSSMKGQAPSQIRAQDPNAPRFSNKAMGQDFRDMVGAEAESLFMIPEAVGRRMAGDNKGAARAVRQGLKASGESLTGRAIGGALGGTIEQGEGGAASRSFTQGVVPGAGGLAGFSGGARAGAALPIANPLLKGAASLGLGMLGAAGGGAVAAGLQRGATGLLLGSDGLREIDQQGAIDQQNNKMAATLGQAGTALLFGKPTADDVRAIPQILGMVRSGVPLRMALSSPAGQMLSEGLRERAMEAGVEVLAAAGESYAPLLVGGTVKPMNTADVVIQALSGAALPGENRLGRVFTGGGQRGAEALISGAGNVQAGAQQFIAGARDSMGLNAQQDALAKSVMDAQARAAFRPMKQASGVQPSAPSATLKENGVIDANRRTNQESQGGGRGVVPSGATPQGANQGGNPPVAPQAPPRAPQTAPDTNSAGVKSKGLRTESIAPEDLGILPGVQYKRGVDKNGVTDLLKGQKDYETEHGGTLTAYRDDKGNLYAVDGHHRRELAQRATRFTEPTPGGGRVEVERRLSVQVLDHADGWTPEEARSFGVLKNLRENKGVAIDAADALVKTYEPEKARSETKKLPPTPLARDVSGLVLLDEPGRALVRNKQVDGSVAAGIGEVLRGDVDRQRVALEQAMNTDGVRSYDDGAALARAVRDEEIVKKAGGQESMFGDEVGGAVYQSTAGEQAAIRGVVKKRLAAEQSSLLAVDKTEARAGEVFDTEGRRKEAGSVKDAKSKADALFEYDPEVKAALRQAASDVANGRISRDEGAKKVREVVLKAGSQTLAEIVKKGNAAAPVAEPSGGGLFGDAPAKAEEPKVEGIADMFADPEPTPAPQQVKAKPMTFGLPAEGETAAAVRFSVRFVNPKAKTGKSETLISVWVPKSALSGSTVTNSRVWDEKIAEAFSKFREQFGQTPGFSDWKIDNSSVGVSDSPPPPAADANEVKEHKDALAKAKAEGLLITEANRKRHVLPSDAADKVSRTITFHERWLNKNAPGESESVTTPNPSEYPDLIERYAKYAPAATSAPAEKSPMPLEQLRKVVEKSPTPDMDEFTKESIKPFAYLLQGVGQKKSMTASEFADKIAETHDLSNDKTFLAYSAIKALPEGSMVEGSSSGIYVRDKFKGNMAEAEVKPAPTQKTPAPASEKEAIAAVESMSLSEWEALDHAIQKSGGDMRYVYPDGQKTLYAGITSTKEVVRRQYDFLKGLAPVNKTADASTRPAEPVKEIAKSEPVQREAPAASAPETPAGKPVPNSTPAQNLEASLLVALRKYTMEDGRLQPERLAGPGMQEFRQSIIERITGEPVKKADTVLTNTLKVLADHIGIRSDLQGARGQKMFARWFNGEEPIRGGMLDRSGDGYLGIIYGKRYLPVTKVEGDRYGTEMRLDSPNGTVVLDEAEYNKAVQNLKDYVSEGKPLAASFRDQVLADYSDYAKGYDAKSESPAPVKPEAKAETPTLSPELETKRTEVLDVIAKEKRNKSGSPVETFLVEGENGRWYPPMGVPIGVKTTENRRSTGWATKTRDGVTVGNKYPTKQEWEQAREQRVANEVKSMAEAMQTPEDIDRQWNYWVKDRQEKKAEVDAAMAISAKKKAETPAPTAPSPQKSTGSDALERLAASMGITETDAPPGLKFYEDMPKSLPASSVIHVARNSDGGIEGAFVIPTGTSEGAMRASALLAKDYAEEVTESIGRTARAEMGSGPRIERANLPTLTYSGIQSITVATDADGNISHAISPNGKHIAPIGTPEARAIAGDMEAFREVMSKWKAATPSEATPPTTQNEEEEARALYATKNLQQLTGIIDQLTAQGQDRLAQIALEERLKVLAKSLETAERTLDEREAKREATANVQTKPDEITIDGTAYKPEMVASEVDRITRKIAQIEGQMRGPNSGSVSPRELAQEKRSLEFFTQGLEVWRKSHPAEAAEYDADQARLRDLPVGSSVYGIDSGKTYTILKKRKYDVEVQDTSGGMTTSGAISWGALRTVKPEPATPPKATKNIPASGELTQDWASLSLAVGDTIETESGERLIVTTVYTDPDSLDYGDVYAKPTYGGTDRFIGNFSAEDNSPISKVPDVITLPEKSNFRDGKYWYRGTQRPVGTSTTPDEPGRDFIAGSNAYTDHGLVGYDKPLRDADALNRFSLFPDHPGVSTPEVSRLYGGQPEKQSSPPIDVWRSFAAIKEVAPDSGTAQAPATESRIEDSIAQLAKNWEAPAPGPLTSLDYAGVDSNDNLSGMTLGRLLDSINRDRLQELRLSPRHALATHNYTDLALAKRNILEAATPAQLKGIKGMWAVAVVQDHWPITGPSALKTHVSEKMLSDALEYSKTAPIPATPTTTQETEIPTSPIVPASTRPVFHEDYTGPRWTYGLQFRPADSFTIPKGFVVGSQRPHSDPKNPLARHGVVDYPRELTPEEIASFELNPVHTAKDIPALAKRVAAEIGKYLDEYVKPENADIMSQKLATEGVRKVIGILDDKTPLISELRKIATSPTPQETKNNEPSSSANMERDSQNANTGNAVGTESLPAGRAADNRGAGGGILTPQETGDSPYRGEPVSSTEAPSPRKRSDKPVRDAAPGAGVEASTTGSDQSEGGNTPGLGGLSSESVSAGAVSRASSEGAGGAVKQPVKSDIPLTPIASPTEAQAYDIMMESNLLPPSGMGFEILLNYTPAPGNELDKWFNKYKKTYLSITEKRAAMDQEGDEYRTSYSKWSKARDNFKIVAEAAARVDKYRESPKPQAASDSFADLVAKQKAAESVPVKLQDINNIRETLPVLKPAQQDDVLFAENRFAAGKEPGVLFTNGTGTGKAQPLDAKLMTPRGWTRMGDIKVGDHVIGADGKPTTVLAVYPQGEKPIYRVGFSDGASTECCDEHLWLTQTLYERRKSSANPKWNCSTPKVRALSEIRETLGKQHFVPIAAPLEFEEVPFVIPPYTMGVILGDGCISQSTITLSSEDKYIIDQVANELPDTLEIAAILEGERCPQYRIRAKTQARRANGQMGTHPWVQTIRDLGLEGAKSATKFVPEGYLKGSIRQRTALLQGLLDTDGWVDKKSHSPYFCSVSRDLADAVIFLARSLGGTATLTSKSPSYTHKGIRLSGQTAYNVCLNLPSEIAPFSLPRKLEIYAPNTKYPPRRKIVSVELVGTKPAQCIAVDNPDHLYVTDDAIVTHNTFTGLGIIKRFERQGKKNILIVAPSQEIIDAWVTSAPHLNLSISQLDDTKGPGEGIVVTTYANLSQNLSLGRRDWDLVLCDEAHKLMSNKEGDDSLASDALQAITLHPAGVMLRTEMLYPEISGPLAAARAERLAAENNTATSSDGEETIVKDVERFDKADAEVQRLANLLDEKRKIVRTDVEARQADRTKVVFLSATPFAYEKTTHYAEGYLFSYPKEGGSTRTGYNIPTGRNKFMVDNFGWSMKTNLLTQPSAEVDRALLQREFNNSLKREGALSGRALDVPFDYDRKFILAESAIGTKIDQGLKILWDDDYYRPLWHYVQKKFGFLEKRYLLEALKAREAIPIIRQHLALGRKVVLFHDYNKGGTDVSPFDMSAIPAGTTVQVPEIGGPSWSTKTRTVLLTDIAAKFAREHPEFTNMPLGRLQSPIEAIKAAFPDVLQINGIVKKGEAQAAVRLFQDDDSGRNLVIVQSAKGAAGISLHDTTGNFHRVLINLGMPLAPTTAIQEEGRIFRVGQASNAIIRYITTGTNWERGTFAQVASKSGEAENLALGEGARALRDQFIQAYMDAEAWPPGHEDEGTGGKQADNEAMSVTSAYDRAKAYYFQQMKKTSRTKAQEGVDYFATPEPIGFKMVEWLDPRKGEALLEPSAGHAAIARWFPLLNERTLVEPSAELSTKAMAAVPDARVIQDRFENLHIVNKYHGIAMNPPFGQGGKTAIEHLEKAWGHLENGGRIVALLPTGPAADKRLEKWMNEIRTDPIRPLAKATSRLPEIFKGDTATGRAFSGSALQSGLVTGASQSGGWVQITDSETGRSVTLYNVDSVEPTGPRTVDVPARSDAAVVAKIKLPGVAFERAGTNVATHIVILEKRAGYSSPTREIDLSDITDIKALFDELENLGMGRRDARLVKSQDSSLEQPITSTTPKAPERRTKTAEEDELLESPSLPTEKREAYLPDDTGAALKAWQEQGAESPYFKRWFGDSKVVDESGAPLIVHHGSPDVRDIFKDGFKARSRGSVFFAARDYATANSYADDRRAFDYQNAEAQTIPLYLSIKNPLLIDAKGQNWRETERYVQEAKDAGHDGIIIKNSVDFYNNKPGAKATTVYAWFAPSQAKSALTGPLLSRVDRQPIAGSGPNRGTFSPESDNLLESPSLPPGEREPSSLHMPATADFGGEELGAMIAPASSRVKIAPIKWDRKPLTDPGKLIDALALATGRAVLVAKQKKGLAGSYRPSDARTSVRWYGDMETSAHEIGHAMDDNFGIVAAYSKPRQKSPWDTELFQQELQATAKTSMTLKLRRAEAVAEWFRAYAMNPAEAERLAPTFTAHVKATVPAHVLKAFEDFGTGARRLAGAPATEAALTHILWGEGDQRSIREKLTEAVSEAGDSFTGNQTPDIFKLTFADKLTANFQDSLRPVVAATDWARKLTGGSHLLPESDPILLMRLHADTVGKVGQMLDTGFVDYRGEAITDPNTGEAIGGLPWLLAPISRPSVAETERLMKLTAIQGVAERTLEKGQQLKRDTVLTGIGMGLWSDASTARAILTEQAQLDQETKDSIEEALRRYRLVANSLLGYMADSGRISHQDAQIIMAENQQYISLQRVMEDAPLFEGSGKSRRLATVAAPVKKMGGSMRQLRDPFVSLLDQTYKIVAESDRNRAMDSFVDLFRSQRALYAGGVVPLSQVAAQTTTPTEGKSIKVFHNGEAQHWEINDPQVYAALKGLGSPAAPTGPLRILSKISAGIPRALITGNPAFAIRNFFRDMPERWMKDALGSKPWDSFKKFSDEEKERYSLSGGTGMGHYTTSRVEYAKAIKAVVKAESRKGTIVRLPSSGPLESYLKLLQAAEVQGRLPAYRAAFKHAKDNLGYDDYNAGLFAAGKARELMDFAVSGNYLRALSPYIPFVNASVQGFAANYKALRRDPAKYLTKFLLLAAAKSLALAILGMLGKSGAEKLEEYRALPAYQRDLCINLPLPWADGWLAIPIGFEAASAAGAIERALDYAMGNKDAYIGYFTTPTATQDDNYLMQIFHGSLVQSMLPVKPDDLLSLGGLPGAMNEMRVNYDTFRQRNIVPPYETNLPLAERKGATSASRAGKVLAAILKTDPRAMDHLIGSMAGGTGRIVTTLSDLGRADKPLTGNRVLGMATGIVKEGPGYGSPQVQRTMAQLKDNRTTPPLVLDRAQDNLKEAKTSPQLEAAKRELRKAASGPMPPAAISLTTAKRDFADSRIETIKLDRAKAGLPPLTADQEERIRRAIASKLGQRTRPLRRDEEGVKTENAADRIRSLAPPGLSKMGR